MYKKLFSNLVLECYCYNIITIFIYIYNTTTNSYHHRSYKTKQKTMYLGACLFVLIKDHYLTENHFSDTKRITERQPKKSPVNHITVNKQNSNINQSQLVASDHSGSTRIWIGRPLCSCMMCCCTLALYLLRWEQYWQQKRGGLPHSNLMCRLSVKSCT